MPQWNWGPIPTVAARLAATVPRRPNGWRRPLAATRPFGGPWGMLVRDRWTDAYRPFDPPGPPWLAALLERFRRHPHAGNPFNTDGELADALCELQRFLVLRNVNLLSVVLPGPAAIPPALLSVSATGLAWALWVHELAAHGLPNPSRIAVPVGALDWPVPPTAADALSLHLWIEELVGAEDVSDPPVESARVPGGLRRRTFLRRFPWLAASSNPLIRQRDAIVRQLLPFSPLTQWVYPDVIPSMPESDGTADVVSLGGGKGGEAVAAARDGWHALLARSLTAALLGPTAAWERRAKAEDELAATRGGRFGGTDLAERKRRLDRTENLRHETQVQGLARPVRLAELLSRGGHAGTLIGLRTLDMLVRHLAATTSPLLLRDQAAAPDRPTLAALAMTPGNRLFRRLTESLFGGARVNDFDALSPPHRATVERLVVPPLPTDGALETIADAAGVAVEQARRVRDHFARVPISLPHPIRDGRPLSPSPAVLLARWCETMKPPAPEPDPPSAEEGASERVVEPG